MQQIVGLSLLSTPNKNASDLSEAFMNIEYLPDYISRCNLKRICQSAENIKSVSLVV